MYEGIEYDRCGGGSGLGVEIICPSGIDIDHHGGSEFRYGGSES